MNTITDDRHFQLRHRYFDVARDRWITIDIIGPYRLDDALIEAQYSLRLHAGDVDRAYVAVEDMRRPILSMFDGSYSNADLCEMIGLYGTEAYYNFCKKG